ncbi:unnamed protein product [Clonostachys rosea f. rosea IK726]|uniref:Uncharacterized protein n=1 Tax=Clonostachys rosea f. rosea IK726 TaxID=1349383 RepID=A0ACA9TGP2_BIOOC|nr:unnamed protein product [Clonostachys rosea f. rosea IK726]
MNDKEDIKGEGPGNANSADAALQFIRNGDVISMTPEQEKKLVRKIDLMLIPLMCLYCLAANGPTRANWSHAVACYFLQYLDKILLNYANVMGFQKDTKITGDQFSELAMMFYITYLAFEFPTGYLMQRFPTAKYLGVNVVLWGVIVASNAGAHNWPGLVVLRLLLGCFEATVAPALMLITTMWYKKSEQPPRVGLWYVGTGLGKMIGGLSSFAFQHYTKQDFKSWQLMFLLWGLATVTVGILVLLFIPDNPMKSKLSEEEKTWAIERLRSNLTGVENKHFKVHQALECLKDPQTWMLSISVLSQNIPNGFVSSYQATVIQSFGFTSKQTALLSMPSGAVSSLCTLGGTWFAGRYNLRGPVSIFLLSLGFLGSSLMAFLPDHLTAGKMVGNYMCNAIGSSLPLMYSYAGANFAGHTKKVTINAIVLIMFCIGNIIGPLTFRDQDKPEYIPAKIAMAITTAVAALVTGGLMVYYSFENRRRDRVYAGEEHRENSEFFDLTDRENHEFRYSF